MEAIIAVVLVPVLQHLKKLLNLKDKTALLVLACLSIVAAAIYLGVSANIAVNDGFSRENIQNLLVSAGAVLGLAQLIYRVFLKGVDGAELPETMFEQGQDILVALGKLLGFELKKNVPAAPIDPKGPPPGSYA